MKRGKKKIMSTQIIIEAIENKIDSLLIGLDIYNAPERLKAIYKIREDIAKTENAIKDLIDAHTEIEAFNRIGVRKHYPDTMKEKL